MLGLVKIPSVDKKSYVKIAKTESAIVHPFDPASFEVEIKVDIGSGQLYAKTHVPFGNLSIFVAEFDEFILDRSLTPRLEPYFEGSFYLEFSAKKSRLIRRTIGKVVMLEYRIGGVNLSYFSGAFEVDQEYLFTILTGLQGLL